MDSIAPLASSRSRSLCLLALLIPASLLAQAQPAPPVSPAPIINYEYDAQGNPTASHDVRRAAAGAQRAAQVAARAGVRRGDEVKARQELGLPCGRARLQCGRFLPSLCR